MYRRSMSAPTPRTLAVVALGLALTACGAGESAGRSEEALAGSPDQYACEVDADCALAPWHFDEEPCCNSRYTSVQSQRFVSWRDAWQARACADIDCDAVRGRLESTLPPAQPLPCYFEPRCNAGQCGGSCQ